MPATQRDDDRWQLALDLAKETAQQYQSLVKIVQNGFASLARELSLIGDKVDEQAKDIGTLQAAQSDCQQRLTRLEAEGVGRGAALKWLLLVGLANAIGWLAVVGLLVWLVARLFSLTG